MKAIRKQLPESLRELNQLIWKCQACERFQFLSMPGYFQKDSLILIIGQNPGQLNIRDSGWDDNSYANESEDWVKFQKGYARGLKEAPLGEWIQEGFMDVKWALTNVIKCRTPGNGLPYTVEIERCRPYLEKQIEIIKPRLIITLGAIAFDWFNTGLDIRNVRGKRMAVFNDFWSGILVPWYHPAFHRYQHDKFSLKMLREAEILAKNEKLHKQVMNFNRI